MHTRRTPLAGTMALAMSGALVAPVAAQGVTIVEDLVFAQGRGEDGTPFMLDLYLADEGSEAPMVVYVAGHRQPRLTARTLAQALAERGVNVMAVDGPVPAPVDVGEEDARILREVAETVGCAVRFARGSEYGSQTAPLVLSGFSYGGGTAFHVALSGERLESVWDETIAAGGPPSQVECVVETPAGVDGFVGMGGTYDVFMGNEGRFDEAYWSEEAPGLREMFRGTIGLDPDVRVRLLHGDVDPLPEWVSATVEAQLAEAGYDVELLGFAGGHVVPHELAVETIMELVSG